MENETLQNSLSFESDLTNNQNYIDEKVKVFNTIVDLLNNQIIALPPACKVNLLPIHKIHANHYNPNKVAPPEATLLKHSIDQSGVTMPILVNRLRGITDQYILIDGFHRYQLLLNNPELQSIPGYIPSVVLTLPEQDCISTSVRHNLARGSHQVELTANLVIQLREMGWSNSKICAELGMDQDEVLRMQQVTGLAAAFKDQDFSMSWK
ncbi:IbrB-like domain-containing protein [Vibrio tapetis]|uniref:Co-activator of prophage gene expression IbrB n=1 Tax=Vibrio tapetis subsp. tapetis TaxID=1671868 RepID=A0A2N8ZJ81_9VIBR|nr:ParB/RepB/Spo0J family partition protein [Vibrio tapetis]SON51959.1 Co-activator of prophage gene expression IbrB [Vibrio tapetis subsp. tapetis]